MKAMLGAERTEEDKLRFRSDVERLRKRLHDQKRGLINPRGKYVQYWDLVTCTALMFTLFVTPFEVGMDLVTKMDCLFVINQIVSLVFLFDMIVQFFLPTKVGKHGEYERRHLRLAWHYAKSWLLIDIISIIPFDILVYSGALSGPVKMVKLLRVLRLLKLIKVLRASSIIERWQSTFAIPSATMTLVSWTFAAVVALHWFACGWALLSQLMASQRGDVGSATQLDIEAGLLARMASADADRTASGNPCIGCIGGDDSTTALCEMPCLTECEREVMAELNMLGGSQTSYTTELSFVSNSENWICRAVDAGLLTKAAVVPDGAPVDIYFTALLVSMLTLVGGVATITPTNITEYVFFFAAILAGTVLFAAVQGIICGVVTTGDPDEIAWRQNNDNLNYMMEDCGMDQEMRVRVRMYFAKAKKMLKRKSYETLVDQCLSDELKGDVRYYISAGLFTKVLWMSGLSRDLLEDLSVKVRRTACAPKETIPGVEDHLIVIQVGVASRAGTFLSEGNYWGDVVVRSGRLRDTRSVTAVTYCEVGMLSRYDLFDVAKDYPEDEQKLRYEGLRMALERSMTIIAAYARWKLEASKQKRKRITEGAEPIKMMEPAEALMYVLHPNPEETWRTVDDAKIKELSAEEQHRKKEKEYFIDEFSKTPADQQAATLGRMLVELKQMMHEQQQQLTGIQYRLDGTPAVRDVVPGAPLVADATRLGLPPRAQVQTLPVGVIETAGVALASGSQGSSILVSPPQPMVPGQAPPGSPRSCASCSPSQRSAASWSRPSDRSNRADSEDLAEPHYFV